MLDIHHQLPTFHISEDNVNIEKYTGNLNNSF